MRKADRIHDLLVEHFSPVALQVIDESHMHAPRPGGESHFKVVVVSDAFGGKAALARHRAVHAALDELLATQAIHALSVHAWTAVEWTGRGEVVPASPPCRGGAKG